MKKALSNQDNLFPPLEGHFSAGNECLSVEKAELGSTRHVTGGTGPGRSH